jgi:hypothetical protein
MSYNKVDFNKPIQKQPTRDNLVAQFLSGIGSVGSGIASGVGSALGGVGQFVEQQKQTPEGRRLLTNIIGGLTQVAGASPYVGAGIAEQSQRSYEQDISGQQEEMSMLQELLKKKTESKEQEQKELNALKAKGFREQKPTGEKDIPQAYKEDFAFGDETKVLVDKKSLKEAKETSKKEWVATQRGLKQYDLMIDSIDKLIQPSIEAPNQYQTTDIGKRISVQGGTGEALIERGQRFIKSPKSQDAVNYLEAITGTGAIKELQEIRQSSPTGGAVGNVSDKDIELLKGAASAIREGMTDAEFVDRLSKLREQLVESRSNLPTNEKQILFRLSGEELDIETENGDSTDLSNLSTEELLEML